MGVKLGQKWAVKDGNLLASNQVGSRFFNKEFDFSRASNGTYVDRDGLLKTAELYNLMPYSQDFGQWTLTNITREDNQIGYDGSNKAYKIIANGTNNDKIRYSLTQISQQTFSAYVKKGNVNFTALEYQGFAYFDLENGLVGTTAGIESASIQDAGNGWYRCSITVTTTANRTAQIYIAAANGSTSTSLGDYIYIQDAQVVEGTEPLDYQYTNGLQGLPRISFEDGVGHLLLEPQRSNLLLQSNSFDTGWFLNTTNVTSGQSGIYGSNDAWLLNSTATGFPRIEQTISASGILTLSVYAKAATDGFMLIRTFGADAQVWFNLNNGNIVNSSGAQYVSSKTDNVGNGWYRCSVVLNGSLTSVRFYPASAYGVYSTSGNGIYIQHAQLESGSYPTSIIETTTTSVTRLADVCNNSGSAQDFNSEEGVLYAEIAALDDDATRRYITISNGSDSYIRLTYTDASNQLGARYYVNGTFQCAFLYTITDTTQFTKAAFKYKENDFALWVNGVEVASDTSGSVNPPNTFNRLDFINYNNVLPFYGKVRNLQAFTEALSDAELQQLTT